MQLTVEQVVAVAPDPSSLAAGRKLGTSKPWKHLGRNAAAVWGECQGSALYQVRVDLSEFGYQCSCPSRKLPCKHVLGLLFLAAGSPDAVGEGEPPEWVTDWLEKRAARAKQKEAKKQAEAKPVDPEAQARRAAQREQRVADGLERLDLWLHDLIRNGLAGLELQPPSFWEEQARRLVDAQAPGLAARVRRAGEIPGSGTDWPGKLLAHLGRLALLGEAYRRLDRLDPALQEDVRQLIGWTVNQDELAVRGEKVADEWLVLGQRVEDEERLRVQRSWLTGVGSGRAALVLQFSAAGQPFPDTILPGTRFEADLVFWPGAQPQRARILARRGQTTSLGGQLSGVRKVEQFLGQTAAVLARQPWTERFLTVLQSVTPWARQGGSWVVRDAEGQVLPLVARPHWKLLALSGGRPVDLAGEWDGEALLPLGVGVEGRYYLLEGTV